MAISPAAICALGACGATLLYLLYLRLLPKPHPGIPYNKEALTSLLGDLPIARRESKGNFSKWIVDQAPRHNSPIVQLFLQPFHKPAILICDYREAQDILMRRKEFDRSDTDIAILSGMSDHFHMNLKTNETWKTHRRLIQHLMAPEFLHGVAAPKIYKSALRLLELWEIKRQISEGKPFAADGDIFHATLDALYDFTFGDAFEGRLLLPYINILNSLDEKQLLQLRGNSKNSDQFHFDPAPVDYRSNLLLHALDLLTTMAATGVPRLAWKAAMLVPRIRRDRDARRNIIKQQVIKGIARLEDDGDETEDTEVKCAVDHMLRQERNTAAKDGREPVYWSPTMRGEVLGFVIAGHDTTSTTFCWTLKFLSDNPASQSRLRKTFQLSYPSAFTSRCLPTADEMTSASIPYLDTFVEEVLRIAHTIGAQNCNTTEDTVILGHAIPKGTQVFFGNPGPGFVAPPLPIDESVRSEDVAGRATRGESAALRRKDVVRGRGYAWRCI